MFSVSDDAEISGNQRGKDERPESVEAPGVVWIPLEVFLTGVQR